MALAEHRKRLASAEVTGLSAGGPTDLSTRLNKPSHSWHGEVNADLDNPCTRCRLYRAVAFGAVDRLRDAENYAQSMAVANTGEVHIGRRRASGFYELFECAVNKEVDLEQRPASGSDSDTGATFIVGREKRKGRAKSKQGKGKAKVSNIVERVRSNAEKDLSKLEAGGIFGRADSKWTWGVDLDSQDLWDMVRGADKNYQVPHSGYDADLRTGKLRSSSPIPSPNDVEDPDEPGVYFDELTEDPSIRELLPHEVSVAFAFPTLHYTAAGKSHPGLQPAPPSGSQYVADADGEEVINTTGKEALQDVVSPDRASTSHPIRSPTHRPWLGQPPHGYIQPPTQPPVILARDVIQLRVASESPLPANLHLDYTSHGSDSDIIMDVASSHGSDGALDAAEGDNSGGEIDVGDLGRDSVEGEDNGTGRYGMLGPNSSNDSGEEIPVGSLGLILADAQTDSGSEIEVGELGLDSVDSGMWAEAEPDANDTYDRDRPRFRARIVLPRVNPATGQYTAESFSGFPDEWLD
jgi:hypothetical protein